MPEPTSTSGAAVDGPAALIIRRFVTNAMDQRRMTYHEACAALGVSNISRIHWLRNSIRHWPEPGLFARLCEAFDLDPRDLLREAGYLE